MRNPFTRLLSAYHYDARRAQFGSFKGYVLRLPEMVADPVKQRGSHPISQVYYTHLHGRQVADHIGRFERLDEAVAHIGRRLGIDAVLPAVNVSRDPEYVALDRQGAYDDQMIEVMQRVYREDFELYGYETEPQEEWS